ncbi:MAG TPA: hypothetical protein VFV70_02790 [Hyphomonadaceae bacterium]|nr:hypothetical protein [Hyphomonadaceae bacterium]
MKSPAVCAMAAIAIAFVTACAGSGNSPALAADSTGAAAPAAKPAMTKVDITDASFGCIRDLKSVRGFYVGNLLGDINGTLAAANSASGAAYPVGSVVQLVPGEAMVKHGKGFNAATNDWEFFELDVQPAATKIKVRGFTETVNQFGGNCFACHAKAEAKWDMICEQGHGCDPIPVTPVMAKAIQNTDPRCAKMELPADQQAALQQLAAFRAAAARAAAPAAPAQAQ